MSRGLFAVILDLLYPPKCPFCQTLLKTGEDAPCPRCQAELPWLVGAAAEQKPDLCAVCVSPLRYQDAVRKAVHRLKFSGHAGYSVCFGRLVAQCVADHLAGQYDVISWIPLSRRRLRRRGYDQARLVAETTAAALGNTAVQTLRKVRDVRAQSGLSDESARRANVLGAYEAVCTDRFAGKRVLLIDDVITTSSTLSECAGVLRAAGAAQVLCATVARAK